MAWYHRLLNMARSNRHSRDLDREMAFHLDERADALRATGLTEDEAAREARRRFGNRTLQKERTHDADVFAWLESLSADVRYALRTLVASPGFALVAILSLALGIGANTAIFSLTDALVLKALPVSHPEQLVEVTMGDNGGSDFTNPLWEQIRDNAPALSSAFAYSDTRFNLSRGGEVQMTRGAWVSGDFFAALGVRPEAGRLLQHGDDFRGCPGVAAVSDAFARRQYGDPANAAGKVLSLDDHPFPVIGAADAGFFGIEVGQTADIYVPLCAQELLFRPGILDARSRWFLNIIGRPKPGLTTPQVSAAMATVAPGIFKATLPAGWSTDNQQEYLNNTLGVVPAATGLSELRERYGQALYILMVVVGVVLLIACANIANLLLARGAARQREISIRMAIGAGRGRLVRQLLTESVLLSILGAALGVVFAHWASRLLVGLLTTRRDTVWLNLTVDGRVLAFTAAVAVGTAVLFGLIPAWRATRVDPQSAMKSGGRGVVGADRHHRLGKSLVVVQVALSLALVTAAGLLLGSFRKLTQVNPGFDRSGVLLVSADFSHARTGAVQQLIAERQLLDALRAIPGARAVGSSLITPISGSGWNDFVLVNGAKRPEKGTHQTIPWFNQVSAGYFHTMGMTLVAGRDIAPTDGATTPLVAVVDRAMARHYFGSASPLGQSFRTPVGDTASAPVTIVGVVETAKYRSLTEDPPGTIYLPFGQGDGGGTANVAYELRADGSPTTLIPAVKAAATQLSPGITLDFTTLSDQLSASLARPRVLATLSGFFGALALLLAMIGLYGTISYDVTRRRNEIGVRIALGAVGARVVRMVIGDAGRLILLGIALGLALAFATTRFVSSFLFGLTATDPTTMVLAALALGLVAIAAALVPAWRAAGVDPMDALREE